MQRVADFRAGQVDGDGFGNRVRRDDQLNGVAHHVEGAAALETGALLFVDEFHMHIDMQRGIARHAQEVDVDRLIHDDVELVIARDHLVDGAIDVEVEDVRLEATGIDELQRVLIGHGNGDGGLLVTIDNSGNTSLTTHFASGPLAHSVTRLCLEHFGLSHGIFPFGWCMALSQRHTRPSSRGDERFMALGYRGKPGARQGKADP
ncbi:hypothetical protein D3C71_1608730 [compost metagenome]